MLEVGKEYFSQKIDRKTFLNLLETLDYIIVFFVDREKYEEKGEDFLVEVLENKYGKRYLLYLPNDLNSNEIPYLIYTLKNKFNLELADNLVNQVVSKSKLALYLLMKYGENIDELRKYAKNDKEFENKVEGVSLFPAREKIKELRKKHEVKSIKDIRLEKSDIDGFFDLDLEKLFFEKGKDLIRYGLYTITQAEQEQIDFSHKGHKKHVETAELDERERLLREAIGIDEWKKKLEQARKEGDKKEIEKFEFEASSKILQELYKYPYIFNEELNGYQPSKIVSSKELYCIGYSIVGHTFLSELGIKHKGIHFRTHSTLEVSIGEKNYLFDATGNNTLEEIDYEDIGGGYKRMYYKNYRFTIGKGIIDRNVGKMLLVSIYNNKGNSLDNSGRYEEAIAMYNKAIKLISRSVWLYNNKGNSLMNLGRYEEAIVEFNRAIAMYDKEPLLYRNKGISLINLGRYVEGITEINKAIELGYSDIEFILYKGYALHKLKLYKEAQKAFDEAYKENWEITEKALRDVGLWGIYKKNVNFGRCN